MFPMDLYFYRARKNLKPHFGDVDAAAVPCGLGHAIGNKVFDFLYYLWYQMLGFHYFCGYLIKNNVLVLEMLGAIGWEDLTSEEECFSDVL